MIRGSFIWFSAALLGSAVLAAPAHAQDTARLECLTNNAADGFSARLYSSFAASLEKDVDSAFSEEVEREMAQVLLSCINLRNFDEKAGIALMTTFMGQQLKLEAIPRLRVLGLSTEEIDAALVPVLTEMPVMAIFSEEGEDKGIYEAKLEAIMEQIISDTGLHRSKVEGPVGAYAVWLVTDMLAAQTD